MTNKKSTELVFWIVIVFAFIPYAIHYFVEKNLFQKIENTNFSQSWYLISEYENKTVNLPIDLRSEPLSEYPRKWTVQKTIPVSEFDKFFDPAIVLGRIGDSDSVRINSCNIGVTGLTQDNQMNGWWWGHLRVYQVPKICLSGKQEVNIEVDVISNSIANQGIFSGPLGLAEYKDIKSKASILEFFRYYIFAVYGVLLFAVGIYYLFVYLLVSTRSYNGIFALCAISTGLYEVMVSTVLYRYIPDATAMMKLNFFSACAVACTFIWFAKIRLDVVVYKYFLKVFVAVTSAFFLVALMKKNFIDASKMYQMWFPIFLIFFVTTFVSFFRKWLKNKKPEEWRYLLAFSIFIATCFYDVLASVILPNKPYLVPYGFMVLLSTVALSLAKEYADAFLYVEAQVGERTKDLNNALEQLKGLEKMKERFFANVSHDLKTPITIALGAIEDAKGQFKATMGKVLDPADRSLRRLQDMVMSILDNVKAESGTLVLEWKTVKVGEFLKNVVEPYQSLCAREGVTLKYSSAGFEGLSVPMDPTKMDRVIENLLSNAVKFTKKTTRNQKIIEVSMKTDQSKLYIHIDDSGIGIPEAERQKVFERFFQSSITNLREHGGSGIGLSFVTEMIALHNGKVYADESPFHGTRMTIELPLSQSIDNLQSYRVQDTNPKILRGSLDVEYPPTTPEKFNAARMTLLVAEDNPEVAQIVYATLKDQYNIYFAENGKRALALLGEQKFDCIVSDIEMPEMSGDEFVEAARKENQWKSIPIIMLSSHGDDDTIVKLLNLGANDYVQKPFRREILLSRIHAQINAYRGTTWNTKMEKLQELGQLVSGIGHQGKNRISRIGSNYPLLIKISKDLAKKLEATQPEDAKRLGEKVEALGGLIGKGYEQTLDLFKAIDRYASGSEQKSPISIEEVFHDTLTLLEEKIQSKNISVQKGDFKNISFDGYNEFREAILNIVSNAVDAVEKDVGAITIHAESKDDTVFISITDNGCGIAKENLSHVFEPFFTSKQVGQGTGLGLYLARDAIELKNQGKLAIVSKGAGQGATVNITVPKSVTDIKHDRHTMHNVGV